MRVAERWLPLAIAALAVSCAAPPSSDVAPPIDSTPPYPSKVAFRVDPFIGTGGEGNTFPGAVVPWGMVSLSPHNSYTSPKDYIVSRKIAPSGYHHGEPYLYDLGLTHLSGVGCPDLGAPTVMATVGDVTPARDDRRSAYTDEVAWPGYYAVHLSDADVRVEATASARVGVLRLRFPSSAGEANVIIDAGQALSWLSGSGRVVVRSASEVEGQADTGGFCLGTNRQTVYFVARFSRGAVASGTFSNAKLQGAREARGSAVGAYFRFDTRAQREVQLAVGVSYVSIDGARRNLERELAASDRFETVRARAHAAWDEALSRVRVEGGTDAQKTQFYTALYHVLLHPNLLSDADGTHPLASQSESARGEPRYTVYSLWDTYRTVHPLLTLLYPGRQLQMVRSLAALAGELGHPLLWELIGQETDQMVGDPMLPMIADTYVKGLRGFDVDALYPLLRDGALGTSAPMHRRANAAYRALGYIPMDRDNAGVWGPVSTTLEYALADWSLAQLARALGHADDAAVLTRQAGAYRELFDATTGVLRPRDADGSFTTPFDPNATEGSQPQPRSGGPGYVEGSAWQYAFFVPHDIAGLAALHGGAGPFVAHLQHVFDAGQFSLWNEPDMAYPYLFTYFAGEAWRTQRAVHQAMGQFKSGPAGLPGNDDAGTLSAWLVFSAMGFYPDCPGSTRYSLGTPLFDRVEIALDPAVYPGGRFVIDAPHSSAGAIYVRGATLGGAAHAQPFLTHGEITAGGTLHLDLASSPPAR